MNRHSQHPMPSQPKAVFLDAGGVLMVPDVARVAGWTGINYEVDEMLDAFAASIDRFDSPEREDERCRWLWEGFLELLGYDPDDSRFASFLGGLGQADTDPWFPAVIGPGVGTALKRLASVTKIVVVHRPPRLKMRWLSPASAKSGRVGRVDGRRHRLRRSRSRQN